MTSALVLGRRRRGRDIEGAVRDTTARLAAAGWTVEAGVVDRKRQLRRRTKSAVASGVDVVVAVGGDGVVLQVLQRLVGTEVPLGIVPMGTGNLVAGNLGMPTKLDKAVDVIIAGVRRRIDVGRLVTDRRTRYFAVACGVGFDAEVMDGTTKSKKRRLGKLAYFASAFRRRKRVRNARHEVVVDGQARTVKAAQVFVANLGKMGVGVEPRLEIRPDDGALDVLVLRASGPIDGLIAGWEAIRQRRPGKSRGGRALHVRGREVRVTTKRRRPVEIDGSVVGRTPIEVSVQPAALTVLVPASKVTATGR
jgi:YegS/Rv2252/BmrU family lipid kinase